jgi:putative ABC transport system permease protein
MLGWTGFHALRLALAGIVVGAVGGWAAARTLENLVFGIPARHPGTMFAAAMVVLLISFAAAMIPAWRAARVDPARRLHSF